MHKKHSSIFRVIFRILVILGGIKSTDASHHYPTWNGIYPRRWIFLFFTNNRLFIHESVHINITSFVLRLRVPADNLLFNYWTPQKTDLVSFQKC